MVKAITNLRQKDRGFTIVELLVVIVVIGILATITIVSYTGITQKANTTKALSNAQSVQNVAEVFASTENYYPMFTYDLNNGIPSGSTHTAITKLPAGIYLFYTGGTNNNATPSNTNGAVTVWYQYCGAVASPTTGAATGARIRYWDFSVTPAALSSNVIYLGSGTAGDAPGTAACNTYQTPAS